MGRFAALARWPTSSRWWATADPQMEELTIPFVGAERSAWQYQIGSLVRQGTRIAFGSDWPVSSADPLQEIHVAVNRVLSERLGRRGEPECEVSLPARAGDYPRRRRRRLHLRGSLGEPRGRRGRNPAARMRADLTVLDQDLFAIPARDIAAPRSS